MLVRFADARPDGAYVLALPVNSGAALGDRLASLDPGARELMLRAAEAMRFEGEAGAIVETFIPEGTSVRRLLVVGMGAGGDVDRGGYDRAGGALSARLLTSG